MSTILQSLAAQLKKNGIDLAAIKDEGITEISAVYLDEIAGGKVPGGVDFWKGPSDFARGDITVAPITRY